MVHVDDEPADVDLGLELLLDLALDGLLGGFPGSTLPPGNSQPPFMSPYPRWVARIFPSLSMIAATTLIDFIRSLIRFVGMLAGTTPA